MTSRFLPLALLLAAGCAQAELKPMADADLSATSGQGGVYLSGEFSINKGGGVLWNTPTTNNATQWAIGERSCATAGASTPESCGMRIAIRTEAAGGWYVLDNLKGVFSFEGLTLRTRLINDSAAGFNQDVIELGLPNNVRFKDGSFAFAVANQGGWRNKVGTTANGGDSTYQQTNIFSAKIDGDIRMQGSVLVFPK